MKTKALFYEDSYIKEFRASVLECRTGPDGAEVLLDETAFYPESGGQPSDLGTLGGRPVTHVFERDGAIVHRLAGSDPLSGAVQGCIDWYRRHDLMQQHCGQHILSAAFARLFDAETVGFHLTDSHTQIDITSADLTDDMTARAEDLANSIVWSPARVIVHWPDEAELARMPLRKQPARSTGIRVVEIEGFDWSPCGGTHPANAAEVGLIKIVRWEKNKGQTRVEFLCGDRALRDYRRKNRSLLEMAARYSVGDDELAETVNRVQEANRELKRELKEASERLLDSEAAGLVEAAPGQPRLVMKIFDGRPIDELRLLAARIASFPSAVALLGGRNEVAGIAMARSVDVDAHMGEICKAILADIEGRGGGSAQSAQCGGPRLDGLEEALSHAARLLGR